MVISCRKDFQSKNYDVILFDLDGTLTQSGIGITRAGAYALAKFGIEKKPEELQHLIGPPLEKEFMGVYGLTQEEASEAVRQFRVYYLDRGWKENAPYEHIEEVLRQLRAAGKTLVVATSKPEDTAKKILAYFQLDSYFTRICGPSMDGPEHAGKVVIIEDAFRRLGLSDTSRCIMVGDRKHDVIGAHLAGIPAVAVLYGYGSREELEQEKPEVLAETVLDLLTVFI